MYKHPNPKARSQDLVVQTLDSETLVYDLVTHKAHCLNEISGFVWQCCDGARSAETIGEMLAAEFRSPVPDGMIELALAQLRDRELLIDADPINEPVAGRREMIKRIGAASVMSLPLITSIATPSKAFVSATCTCTASSQCSAYPSCPNTLNCNQLGLCAPNV